MIGEPAGDSVVGENGSQVYRLISDWRSAGDSVVGENGSQVYRLISDWRSAGDSVVVRMEGLQTYQ